MPEAQKTNLTTGPRPVLCDKEESWLYSCDHCRNGLGAEVMGVDVTPVDESKFGEIYNAFLDCRALLFRGQRLTTTQHIAFSRGFGAFETQRAHRLGFRGAADIDLIVAAPRRSGLGRSGPKLQSRSRGK